MTNLDPKPQERVCGDDAVRAGSTIIEPREVPLGGPRAMTVRRTLPARQRSMIGAYCFVDHYGPDDVSTTGGMVVPPHPHTSLQTVSWLFSGQIEHRDSTGVVATVVPGQLNLMTAGHGVCHSEVSVVEPGVEQVLHGVQLWTALPAESVDVAPHFDHFEPEPVRVDGASVSVFLGRLTLPGGREVSSPVPTYTPLLGAEIRLDPGAELVLGLDRGFEHGVLLDRGGLNLDDGCDLARSHLLHEAPGPESMTLRAGEEGADLILLGGPPFGEQIVMWWNFVGRSHEDVVAARERWQAELGHDPDGRFGAFDYPGGESLPAPAMPHVRLRPRGLGPRR
ncbi:pirin family protein [Ornithinimicrobium avium]|uniref:Pirin family protein n=1 Tax=Ornithinimicrobium avium TaxID=2283195 RepID=A0A345NMG2_9MICO|nr:pirin family protein [Ornithinimicrobium avium]AXH96220.1 pirin family protein [Ornithinimicrobium avium]